MASDETTTKREEPLWKTNPRISVIHHESQDERKQLEESLQSLPDTPEGDLARAAARMRFAQHWHDKTRIYGFLTEARNHGETLDQLLKEIIK